VGGGQEQFGDLGDEPDQRVRGEMLDEGLKIVTGLWSGEEFQFDGKYYHVRPTTFRPKPVQQPRIPIWAAGVWPHKRPLARMARWDGMFPLFWGIDDPAEQAARLREMVASVMHIRQEVLPESAQRPFDIIMTGATPPDRPDQTREHISRFADAGATWWLESLEPGRGGGPDWSFKQLRERVLAGPVGKNI
jgi:alkanesulfonate monooxygenase SsuD/methylene tetrahydromethanopterin reductase-like flavin-dependent oxidoreductase (luciferase family)